MFIHPETDPEGDDDDPLEEAEKRTEFREVQFQWLLIAIYGSGMALFVAWAISVARG